MHIGEKVEARAKELRIGATELARKIRTSKQNVYSIYKRSSIDTDLLQKLSKALEFDFFAYFIPKGSSVNQQKASYDKRKRTNSSPETELLQLKKEHNELREKFELLKELYEMKTGKKIPGTF